MFRRFRRWATKGVFERLFTAISEEPDFEYIMVDGPIVRAHQHATGQKGTLGQAMGRSRDGLTTKIVVLVDALGTLVRFVLLPGQRHDSIGVAPLIDGIAFDAFIGNKEFGNDPLRTELERRKAQAVIPPKADRKTAIACDFGMFRWRHLVELFSTTSSKTAAS